MAQQIYLVRHGEAALNADGRLRGLADPTSTTPDDSKPFYWALQSSA